MTVSVDNVGFPLQNAMFAGQTSLNPAAACYVRYKFYDRSNWLSSFVITKIFALDTNAA